jgi:hypothetical protein
VTALTLHTGQRRSENSTRRRIEQGMHTARWSHSPTQNTAMSSPHTTQLILQVQVGYVRRYARRSVGRAMYTLKTQPQTLQAVSVRLARDAAVVVLRALRRVASPLPAHAP